MGVQIPIGFAQARFSFSLTGDIERMFCLVGISPDIGDTALAIATQAHNAWVANVAPVANMYQGWSTGPTQVQFRVDANPPVVAEFGGVGAGTVVGETLPANCAFLIRKRTAVGGRRNRGRLYLPPAFQSEFGVSKNGIIDSGTVTIINSRVEGFRVAMELADRPLVLLHSDGGVPTPIVSMSCDPLIATQRRRLRP